MIDFARIKVIAGSGGSGAGSFFRTKGKRLGKADGGDGGRGGDVYLLASRDLNTLEPFRFVKEYKAKHGERGSSNNRKGAEGEDLVIKVPVGTQVKVMSQSDESDLSTFHFDLVEDSQKVLVACGGEGGRGNAHLRDEFGRRPKAGEKGEDGEEVELTLELKLIADVGLIGLPNAGKSTLLGQITKAHPQIAHYPFTTLEPNLGVVQLSVLGFQFSDSSLSVGQFISSTKPSETDKPKTDQPNSDNRQLRTDKLVVADIPGLVEGASEGRGLGHLFLRHIERTKILVHLIDVSADVDPIEAYKTVRGELKTYSVELSKKKEIVALNKIDLVSKEQLEQILAQFKKMRKPVVAISAKEGKGLEQLIGKISQALVG